MLKTMNQKLSLILLALAAFYLIMTYQLPSYAYTQIDANMVPQILGWLLVILSIGLFFIKDSETEEQKANRDIPKQDVGMLLGVAGLLLAYIFLLNTLGFVLDTFLFIFLCTWFLGYKKYIPNLIVSIIFPIATYLLFTEFLRISLPSGFMPF